MANIDDLVSGRNGFRIMMGSEESFLKFDSEVVTPYGEMNVFFDSFTLNQKEVLFYDTHDRTLYLSIQPDLIPKIKKEIRDLVTKEITGEIYLLEDLERKNFDGIYISVNNGLKVRVDNVKNIEPMYDDDIGPFFFSYENPVSITSMSKGAFCVTYESPTR